MTCHKELGEYSVRIKVWHIDAPGHDMQVYSDVGYKKAGVEVHRSLVLAKVLLKFDKFTDECVADYIDHLED